MNNNRHWVTSLWNIPCPVSSHAGIVSCRFVHWMCLPTSVPAWLTAQAETYSHVSGQPHPAQLQHVLPASGSSLSLAYMRPSWESWSWEKAASLPVEKVTGQGLAGNFNQLCTIPSIPLLLQPRMRLHSKVKRQNTALRTDRMGYLCSYSCLNEICHGADD